jgi:hypothetical protein
MAEEALSKTYETINAFAALFYDVFLRIKGISSYLVILAMFPCYYCARTAHARRHLVPRRTP